MRRFSNASQGRSESPGDTKRSSSQNGQDSQALRSSRRYGFSPNSLKAFLALGLGAFLVVFLWRRHGSQTKLGKQSFVFPVYAVPVALTWRDAPFNPPAPMHRSLMEEKLEVSNYISEVRPVLRHIVYCIDVEVKGKVYVMVLDTGSWASWLLCNYYPHRQMSQKKCLSIVPIIRASPPLHQIGWLLGVLDEKWFDKFEGPPPKLLYLEEYAIFVEGRKPTPNHYSLQVKDTFYTPAPEDFVSPKRYEHEVDRSMEDLYKRYMPFKECGPELKHMCFELHYYSIGNLASALVEDGMSFTAKGSSPDKAASAVVKFGCIFSPATSAYFEPDIYGLMGLGNMSISIPYQMAKKGLIQHVVGFCFQYGVYQMDYDSKHANLDPVGYFVLGKPPDYDYGYRWIPIGVKPSNLGYIFFPKSYISCGLFHGHSIFVAMTSACKLKSANR